MSWFASSINETEAAKAHALMFVAVDFDFPSGHARFWSGWGSIVISGNTYLGVGTLGAISVSSEATNLVTDRKTFQLSMVDPALISESDIDNSFGRSVVEYFGFFDSEKRTLLDTPEINWEGRMDSIRRIDGAQPIIEVNAEHRLVMLDKADGWRYTHEHQQLFFAGDLGFNQVGTLDSKVVLWGGQRTVVGVHFFGHLRIVDYGD